MAIGARISSENLSGKTATVTFTPYTGQTSGSTVNLGTKTIPFNNLNAHPYGVYSLYLSEYDYTYTLNVPEPSNNPQTFVFIDRMVGSNNFGAAFLNFSDLTAEIIDLGVNTTNWYTNNVYPLQNSGYLYTFSGQDNGNDRLAIFTDENGLEIHRYTGTTNNYNANSLDGRILFFEDEDNGVLTYSNGKSVFTYTWDPQTHFIDVEWDWYGVTLDKTFIIKKFEQGSWNYNGNGQSFLVNTTDGTTTLFKTWVDGIYVRHKMQPNANFIVVETQDQTDNYRYTNFEICNSSGTVLETVSLTGDTYTSRNDEFLGSTKYSVSYHNYSDNNIDYKIIHYNGETETLTQSSHIKGSNFSQSNIIGDNDFWSNSNGMENGGVAFVFYNSIDGTSIGTVSSYCDIVYMLDNQTSFNTYVLADDTQVEVNTYGQLSNIYRTQISTNGFFEVLTISTTGGTITTTDSSSSGINNINYYELGDRTIYQIYTNNAQDVKVFLIDEDGSIMDTLNKSLNSSYSSNVSTQGNLAYLTFTLSEAEEAYYVYSGSTGFTSTDLYSNNRTPDTMYSDTFMEPEVMVLYSEGGPGMRVLSTTGITSDFQFPNFYGRDIVVGETKFMCVYVDGITNNVIISLYNFSGELLNSHSTAYNGWNNTYGIGDRFVVRFNGNDGYELFLVSEDTITSVSLDNYDNEWAPNDYNWWND